MKQALGISVSLYDELNTFYTFRQETPSLSWNYWSNSNSCALIIFVPDDKKSTSHACRSSNTALSLSPSFQPTSSQSSRIRECNWIVQLDLANWIVGFEMSRPQVVKYKQNLLHNVSEHRISIGMYSQPPSILSVHSQLDHQADRVRGLSEWCDDRSLCLNLSKTEEMIIDYRWLQEDGHIPLWIGGAAMERVRSITFLHVYLSDNLTLSFDTKTVVKSSCQWLYFPQRLRKFGIPPQILTNVYKCTIESIIKKSLSETLSNWIQTPSKSTCASGGGTFQM